ncbi:MAG: ABC transporter ATP-binding protein [Candidatus Omnitrophota bacterium]|jgi:ABC-type polysaccharide/polyol phosphate transport system ATPase subunit
MKRVEIKGAWEKYLIKFINQGKVSWEEIWALEDINLEIDKGQTVCLIGQNGSGKTTLLRLIAGMLLPDKGEVNVDGRVSALMELGAGFNPEFTGRENISLNARMYGLSDEALAGSLTKIIDFADLGKFIDAPIKYYSQGMFMRLAFSLAIFVEPDILLIDEVLSVGDEEARQKCIKMIFDLKNAGKTIVLVTHDLDMAVKLCDRAILIEKGKIIKDGLPKKIIPYYFETIGDKSGVAVLGYDKYRIVFNNGKLSISYEDNLLSRGFGGSLSFFSPCINRWLSSSDLSWKINRLSENKIIAEGSSGSQALSQIWTVELLENQLKWDMELKESLAVDPHMDLFLSPDYKKLFTADKDMDIPDFSNKSDWQELYASRDFLGFSAPDKSASLPLLLFKANDRSVPFRAFNTGYIQEARVMQAHLGDDRIFSFSIRFFPSRKDFEDLIWILKEELRQKREAEEQEKARAQKAKDEERILAQTLQAGNFRVFADVDSRKVKIYFREREVSSGKGIYSDICMAESGVWINPDFAQWQVRRTCPEELSLIFVFPELFFRQIWVFRAVDNRIILKVSLETDKQFSIISQYLRFEVSDKFKEWKTIYEKGDVAAKQYYNNIAPIRIKDNKVTEIILGAGSGNEIAPLGIRSYSGYGTKTLSVFKKKESNGESICVNYSAIIPRNAQLISPGRVDLFEGEIVFSGGISLSEPIKKTGILKRNNLGFIFDSGRGKIFFDGRELTKDLGVYTSLRSNGIWYDSFQGVWDFECLDDFRMIARGDWQCIPVSQTWIIEFLKEGCIYWKVVMDVYEVVDLEIQQASVMLSPEYKIWEVSGIPKGYFSQGYTNDYDILPFRFWNGKSGETGLCASGDKIPGVCFKNIRDEAFCNAIVENTDSIYRGRLLQYQKENLHKLLPGKYDYFEGVIKIESTG